MYKLSKKVITHKLKLNMWGRRYG